MSSFSLAQDSQNSADSPKEEDVAPLSLFAKTPTRDEASILPSVSTPEDDQRSENQEENEEDRRRREEEESVELARQLMAEEAMASYHHHFGLLNQNRDNLSQEDFDALQAVLQEDEQEEIAELEDDEGELSYEAMLQLGERIGDVKSERWALKAQKIIERFPTFCFLVSDKPRSEDVDDSEIKCLVCQCDYEEGEKLRRLPCNHCFHAECSDQWLKEKDICPYCRQSVDKPN